MSKNKRIRYAIPTYKKVYSVYQYDRSKYSKIFKKLQALALKYDSNIFYRTNPYRVLDLCYKLDKKGKLQRLGDERHIFRYCVLQNILKEIADYLLITYELPSEDVLTYLFRRTHIILFTDENQAELLETIRTPINIRLKVHITLLKCLRAGMEIEDAVITARNKHHIPYLKY